MEDISSNHRPDLHVVKLVWSWIFTLDPINRSIWLNYVGNFYILNKNNLCFLSTASLSHDPVTSKQCPVVSLHWTSKTRLFSFSFTVSSIQIFSWTLKHLFQHRQCQLLYDERNTPLCIGFYCILFCILTFFLLSTFSLIITLVHTLFPPCI